MNQCKDVTIDTLTLLKIPEMTRNVLRKVKKTQHERGNQLSASKAWAIQSFFLRNALAGCGQRQ
jgi:hypothetical protein